MGLDTSTFKDNKFSGSTIMKQYLQDRSIMSLMFVNFLFIVLHIRCMYLVNMNVIRLLFLNLLR